MRLIALAVAVSFVLSGCGLLGWETHDRREAYLEAGSIEPVKIPEGLDRPDFQDALVIPEARDLRQIAGQRLDLGLPEALSTSYGVDQIVIKKLDDERWVFVDSPPAMVWPKVRAFFSSNRIPLDYADPARGEMQTQWLAGDGENAKAIFAALKGGGRSVNRNAKSRHQFRVRLEPGIRDGSTEIYLEHKRQANASVIREDAVEWNGESDNDELEGEVLSGIAYYLGDNINTSPAFSAMASTVGGGQKAELVPDKSKPVLKYRLSFERAWATVGNALDNARIDIEDLDRGAATYYVYYDDSRVREPGFLGRLFSGDDENEPGAMHRYEVHLDDREDEVHVTVKKDEANLADALVAEKLLQIIKQYST